MFFTQTRIRVRYADTDQMKMAYYARFFEYFEQGRSDLLREIGLPYPEIERMGFFLPVLEAHAQYIKPARYDDELLVKTIVKEPPQVRIRIEYEIRNAENGELLTDGFTVHGFVSAASGKPARAPDRFLKLLQEALAKPVAVEPTFQR